MIYMTKVFRGAHLGDLLRFGNVKRWGIVSTINSQTVADHSARVALIGMFLVDKFHELYRYVLSDSDWEILRSMVCATCVLHDLEEVFTGDVPGPAKKVSPPAALFDHTAHINCGFHGVFVDEFRKLADKAEEFVFLDANAHDFHGKVLLRRMDVDMYSRCDDFAKYMREYFGETHRMWKSTDHTQLVRGLCAWVKSLKACRDTDINAFIASAEGYDSQN